MKRINWLIGGPLVLGVALRAWQWGAGTSLWVDELWIADNVRARSLGGLVFEPLAHQQMAPPGFLALVDATTAALGLNEHTLRLVPFLMGVLALLVLWRVARRFLTGVPLAGALLLSAVSPALVWYSGNVKQYAGDVALSLALVLLALRHVEAPSNVRRALSAGGFGALAMISSYAAVLTGAVLGTILFFYWIRLREARTFRPLAVLGSGWALGAGATMWASLRFTSPDVVEHMHDFWRAGFAPWQDGLMAVLLWIPERAFNVLAHHMVFMEAEFGGLAIPTAILALFGVIVAWPRYRVKALLLAAPLLGAWMGGLTQILPMRHRVGVYAGASVLVLGMIGLQGLLEHRSPWVKACGVLMAVLAILPTPAIVLGLSRPPYRSQETRPVLAALSERMRGGDVLYVYCPANAAAEFYGPAVGITDYISGGCSTSEAEFIEELRALPAGRVWFFYTQWTPERPWPDAAREFLTARGREVERIDDPYELGGQSDAAAILYELDSDESNGADVHSRIGQR